VSRCRNNLCDTDLIEYLADCSFCCLAGEFPAGIEFNKARDSSRRVLGAHMLLLMLCSSVLQTECTLVSTILLSTAETWLAAISHVMHAGLVCGCATGIERVQASNRTFPWSCLSAHLRASYYDGYCRRRDLFWVVTCCQNCCSSPRCGDETEDVAVCGYPFFH
jgi:hypothetical protein